MVEWAVRNADSTPHSFILYRDSYYFGESYWSVYSANPAFHTSILDGREVVSPLDERGVVANVAPLGLVGFSGPQERVVCFIFTLSPAQVWGMLEGGFSQTSPPSGIAVYDVTPSMSGDFCIGYDPRAVRDWNAQTRTYMQGYAPNPQTFNTWLFQAEAGAPFRKPFSGDSADDGRCAPPSMEKPVPVPVSQTAGAGGTFPPVFPDVLSPPLNP